MHDEEAAAHPMTPETRDDAQGFALCPWADPSSSHRPEVVDYVDDVRAATKMVAGRVPFVARGVQAGTDAARRWSFADLRARWGERELPVIPLRDGMLSYESKDGIEYVPRRLTDVLDRFATDVSPTWYVSVAPGPYFPGLAEEARVPSYSHAATWRASRVWIGTGGTVTPIHHELTDNVLCLISGRKEVALFPPRERSKLRPSPLWSGTPHISRIDPRASHVDADTRGAEVWRCVLHAGDSLFVPRGWWHVVRTTGESIAINYWWASGPAAYVPRAAELYKKVFGLST